MPTIRKSLILCGALLLTALLGGCSSGSSSSGTPTGTLDLTIVEGNSDPVAGIADATILVFDATTGNPVTSLTSNADGVINEKLDVGTYQLKISATGYSPSPAPGVPPVPVTITKKETTSVSINLYPLDNAATLGTISGKVTDASGNGIAGALVVGELGGSSVATNTAEDGSYTLHNVPEGDASLTAFIGGFNFPTISPVTVTAGEITANQNIESDSLAGGSISGSVTFTSTSAALVDVTLLHPGTREVIPGMRTYIDLNNANSYELTDVPDGHFEIIASLQNDGFVLDPDIAVTQGIPTVDIAGDAITKSFKVTGAIALDTPAEPVDNIIPELSATPSFAWHQASSYSNVTEYVVEVVDESGTTVWGGFDPISGMPNVVVPKADPINIDYNFDTSADVASLEAGRYYQLRVYASKDDNTAPLGFKLISASETLDGLFKIEMPPAI